MTVMPDAGIKSPLAGRVPGSTSESKKGKQKLPLWFKNEKEYMSISPSNLPKDGSYDVFPLLPFSTSRIRTYSLSNEGSLSHVSNVFTSLENVKNKPSGAP